MKPKEVAYLMGLAPRSRTREYGYRVATFTLPDDGRVDLAQWLHPKETPKVVSQEAVNSFRQFLTEGDVAIDIGAHTGDSTVPIALAVGKTGRVLALEPNPYVFRILAVNASLNEAKTNIEPLCFAAAESDGRMTFEYSDPGYCNGGFHKGISRWQHGHAFPLEVETRNLADYLRQERPELLARLRYIKIDAEGYDYFILKSLEPVIRAAMPLLTVELFKHLSPDIRSQLFHLLAGWGYDIYRVEGELGTGRERMGEREFLESRHSDVFCVPR